MAHVRFGNSTIRNYTLGEIRHYLSPKALWCRLFGHVWRRRITGYICIRCQTWTEYLHG